MKKYWVFFIILMTFLAACGGSATPESVEPGEIDSESGLPLNPISPPADAPFIVDGEIANMNLTPQTEPEFVIRIESGKTFRVRTQELSAITYDDGEVVGAANFQQGMRVRATIFADTGGAGTNNLRVLRTNNLTVIR